jgi:hypothetical protein
MILTRGMFSWSRSGAGRIHRERDHGRGKHMVRSAADTVPAAHFADGLLLDTSRDTTQTHTHSGKHTRAHTYAAALTL